jgi:hypothetical protein
MDRIDDDQFIVFLRHDPREGCWPDHAERPLVSCSSYGEARRIQRELLHAARDSVIRFVGPAGGGD